MDESVRVLQVLEANSSIGDPCFSCGERIESQSPMGITLSTGKQQSSAVLFRIIDQGGVYIANYSPTRIRLACCDKHAHLLSALRLEVLLKRVVAAATFATYVVGPPTEEVGQEDQATWHPIKSPPTPPDVLIKAMVDQLEVIFISYEVVKRINDPDESTEKPRELLLTMQMVTETVFRLITQELDKLDNPDQLATNVE